MAIQKTETGTKVWNALISAGLTQQGAAGLMGNIFAESGMIANRVEVLCLNRLKTYGYGEWNDISYTAAVDNGSISKERFLNPIPNKQYGYGLCQWTSPGRKKNLYEFAKEQQTSIGDANMQIQFLIKQLKASYLGVYNILKTTNSIQIASDKVLKDFQSPNNWSAQSNQRASYGQQYYNLYKGSATKSMSKINWKDYYGKISNSGGDERGRATGGQAGDQTGNEWTIRTWYNRPWSCVLRHPDQQTRELIAELSIEAANNNLIGYDQYERYTYWDHLKASNYRPSQITIACEADCSAGVIANTRAAGYLLNNDKLKNINATYTGNMRQGFKAAGFTVLTESKYLNSTDYLMPGDILLNDAHHTATNLGIGRYVDYKTTQKNTPVTQKIDDAKSFNKEIAGEYITTDLVNLRVGAATKKTLITPIQKGETVTNYGYHTGQWYLVKYKDNTGFCSSKYLKKKESEKLNETPIKNGIVIANSLYVRTYAGKEYAPLKSIPIIKKNQKVQICDQVKAKDNTIWYFVRINGSVFGFVSSSWIQVI